MAFNVISVQIFSQWARDIATKPSSLYTETFDHVFHQQMVEFSVFLFVFDAVLFCLLVIVDYFLCM